MGDPALVEVGQSFQHLQGVNLNHSLILDSPILKKICQRAAGTVLHKNIDLVSVNFNTMIRNDVRVIKDLKNSLLVPNLLSYCWNHLWIVQPNFFYRHQ